VLFRKTELAVGQEALRPGLSVEGAAAAQLRPCPKACRGGNDSLESAMAPPLSKALQAWMALVIATGARPRSITGPLKVMPLPCSSQNQPPPATQWGEAGGDCDSPLQRPPSSTPSTCSG